MDKEKKKIVAKGGKTQVIINPPEKKLQRGIDETFKDLVQKRSVIIEKKTEMILQAKAQRADLPEDVLQQVYVRGLNEFDQIDELNRDTLFSYHKKADKDIEKAHRVLGPQIKAGDANSANKTSDRIGKRLRGLDRSVTRLNKEQYAMNRVNSFISGGAALVEDCDLIPIVERLHTRLGTKGSGGAMRPHIKREKSPYNRKTVFYVVDSQGHTKYTSQDEFSAKRHLAQKYNSYMSEGTRAWVDKGESSPASPLRHHTGKGMADEYRKIRRPVPNGHTYVKLKTEGVKDPKKRFEGTNSLVKVYKDDTPGQIKEAKKLKGKDPCWDGYKMVGLKPNGDPNCVGPVKEAATPAWTRKEGKNPEGGLNRKGIASYRAANPGSKLSLAVTTKPSKLKAGSKAANRRNSFCARMSGVDGPMKKPNGEPTRKALALRKWNCNEQVVQEEKDYSKHISKLRDMIKTVKQDVMNTMKQKDQEAKQKEQKPELTPVDHNAALTHFATQHKNAQLSGNKELAKEYAKHYHDYSAKMTKLFHSKLKKR